MSGTPGIGDLDVEWLICGFGAVLLALLAVISGIEALGRASI